MDYFLNLYVPSHYLLSICLKNCRLFYSIQKQIRLIPLVIESGSFSTATLSFYFDIFESGTFSVFMNLAVIYRG